mmetsp:Transcript_7777/g.28606  ORF Transcript_7777/g.28606 Transcript_7777/m.28606 type:complete len:203 (-) Transcript_7777:371-979(-)
MIFNTIFLLNSRPQISISQSHRQLNLFSFTLPSSTEREQRLLRLLTSTLRLKLLLLRLSGVARNACAAETSRSSRAFLLFLYSESFLHLRETRFDGFVSRILLQNLLKIIYGMSKHTARLVHGGTAKQSWFEVGLTLEGKVAIGERFFEAASLQPARGLVCKNSREFWGSTERKLLGLRVLIQCLPNLLLGEQHITLQLELL